MSEIEKGIPIPTSNKPSLVEVLPELLHLQIGDSFIVEQWKIKLVILFGIKINLFGLRNNQEHEIRELDNGDFRVWRSA